MKRTKIAISLILCSIICLAFFAACKPADNTAPAPGGESAAPVSPAPGGSSSQPAPQPDAPNPDVPPPEGPDVRFADSLDFIIDANTIPVVNPINVAGSSVGCQWTYRIVYDTLIDVNEDFSYTPRLATSWQTDDWQTITFSLRDDVVFHNGDRFTADDVINTVLLAKDHPGTIAADRWAAVESITALDPYTVQIVLSSVNVECLYDFAHPGASILNKRETDADPEKGVWIGTGAYMVTELAPNDYVTFTRNDNYWFDPPITRQLTLRHVPEVSARMMMLENGEVDGCLGGLSVFDSDRIVENTNDYVCYEYYPPGPAVFGFNMEHPIVGDWNFRMAVGSAIDREEMTYVARGNYGIPETHGSWWGMVTQYYDESIPIVAYDLDAAKAYLDASPYNGEVIEIVACFPDNAARAELLQNSLAKIGVTCTVKELDPPSLASYVAYGRNQAAIISFMATWTPTAASARNILLPEMYHNRWSYNNPEITRMLAEAALISDDNARREHYMQIQRIVAEDPPGFNVLQMRQIAACHKGVAGFSFFGDLYDLRYVYRVLDN